MRRRVVLGLLVVVVAGALAAVVTTSVLRDRGEREVRAVLDEVGAPEGFRRVDVSVTGSVYCFGPCLRGHARYVSDVPFAEAVAQMTAHLRSRGATKSCLYATNCTTPLAPEDCTVLTDGPECLMAPTVGGRTVFVGVSRSGPPTELRVTAGREEEINLFF